MESSLRHILHFNQPDGAAPSNHDRHHEIVEGGRNLTIDELSQNNYHEEVCNDDSTVPRKRSNPSARLSYPRKRAIRACQKCRVRRTKCDNVRPSCTACLDLGAECVYSEGDPSTFDTASLAILEKLNTIEDLLRKPHHTPPALSAVRHDSNAVQTPASIPSVLSAAAPERSIASTRRRMSIETVLSWQAFADQSPNLNLKNLLVGHSIGQESSSMTMDLMHGNGTEERLLNNYLNHVFIFNPVLEEAVLQQYIREIQFHGLKWDAKSCLLLLIYSHGCLSYSEDLEHPADSIAFRRTAEFCRAEQFFEAAQKRMGILLCKSTVIEAQCFFLAGVYLMATLRPLEAWKMFVQALTCCQAFTTQHDSTNEDRDREQRMQESIYWTCFKSELELRLELNILDNSIWDLTYPTFYPSPPESVKDRGEAVWFYYLAEIALRRLSNRILTSFHKYTSSLDFEAVAAFEQQASDWRKGLPPVLNFELPSSPHLHKQSQSLDAIGGPGGTEQLADSLKFILDGHLLDCYEMMYWPFLTEVILNGVSQSHNHHIETLAYKGLAIAVQRIQKNEHGFFSRHHGTWLMLRSCTRSALVLIAARRDPILVSFMPDGWESAIRKVAGMLRFWKAESRDCGDRLGVIERCMADIQGARIGSS